MGLVKNILILFLFLIFCWNYSGNEPVQITSFSSELIASERGQDQVDPHDCSWDGDDIISDRVDIPVNLLFLKTGLIKLYLGNKPSGMNGSVWQPPKYS
jgi:hypothetical protein